MDDDRLIAALVEGDHTALRELFERHAPWLAARLRQRMPGDAVEDVLQETFIAVWRNAGSYRGEGAVGAWIWGIAARQVALWARKHRRSLPEFGPVPAEDPAEQAIRRVDLDDALQKLGPEDGAQRELVRLVYVEGYSIADAAGRFKIPAGTVKSRLHHIRRVLRAALEGRER
jgi:RNA polymerase sigma-70 factor (ECF subfamily)